MDQKLKVQLIVDSASSIHQAWCDRELSNFYARFLAERRVIIEHYRLQGKRVDYTEIIPEAARRACFVNGQQRNVLAILDNEFLYSHPNLITNAFQTEEGFKHFIEYSDAIAIQRFVKRNLTPSEIAEMGPDYNPKTKEENILRPFVLLSEDSRKENIAAAQSAVAVYEELMQRGYSLTQLRSEELKNFIGKLIHAHWMKRNPKTQSNSYLFVPYSELSDFAKAQDLDVFYAMLDQIEKSPETYFIAPQTGKNQIDADAFEQFVLDQKNTSRMSDKEA